MMIETTGWVFGELVGELAWAEDDRLMLAVESQLGGEYWTSGETMAVEVTEADGAALWEVLATIGHPQVG